MILFCYVISQDIIVPEASEFAQWVPEGVDTDCPVTAVIPTWKTLTTLDMSHNQITCIDESVVSDFPHSFFHLIVFLKINDQWGVC